MPTQQDTFSVQEIISSSILAPKIKLNASSFWSVFVIIVSCGAWDSLSKFHRRIMDILREDFCWFIATVLRYFWPSFFSIFVGDMRNYCLSVEEPFENETLTKKIHPYLKKLSAAVFPHHFNYPLPLGMGNLNKSTNANSTSQLVKESINPYVAPSIEESVKFDFIGIF